MEYPQLEVVDHLAQTAAIAKLAKWGKHPSPPEYDYGGDRVAKMEHSGRPFEEVLAETRFEEFCREAKIFLREMRVDPRVEAVASVAVEEEDQGAACGVCQEEFSVGEKASAPACMHKFHGFCLWQWLEDHTTCPLCRFRVLN